MRGALFATIHPTKVVNIRQISTFNVRVYQKKREFLSLYYVAGNHIVS